MNMTNQQSRFKEKAKNFTKVALGILAFMIFSWITSSNSATSWLPNGIGY